MTSQPRRLVNVSSEHETLPCRDLIALGNPVTETTTPLVAMGIKGGVQTLDGKGEFVHAKKAIVSMD